MAALVLAVACMLMWIAPAVAADTTTSPATSSTVIGTETKTVPGTTTRASASEGSVDAKAALILDASFSMVEEDADGPRIDAAKKATHELIDSLPDTANIGLLTYGAQESNAPDNRERGCRDIQTLVPVWSLDRQEFGAAIDGLTPKGYTPMGNALRKAAEELGNEGERSIILVSDGIDSCAPPEVCDVAKELAGQGVDLAIHTVGFKADEEARAELECIAQAGGGQFLEAADAGSLAESLKFLAQRGVDTYKADGTPFEFADTPEDAKWLGEGQYRTTIPADANSEQNQYFRLSIPPRHHGHVVVTPMWQTDGDWDWSAAKVEIRDVTNEGEENCGFLSAPVTARQMHGRTHPGGFAMKRDHGTSLDCDMSDILVTTQLSGVDDAAPEGVDVEVQVFYEPVADEAQEKEWEANPLAQPSEYSGELKVENPQPLNGGTSFNDAAEITEGSYSGVIVPGEYRYYKIPVSNGQRPVVTAKSGKSLTGAAGNIKFGVMDPLRHDRAQSSLGLHGEENQEGPIAPPARVWPGIEAPYQGDYYIWFSQDWVYGNTAPTGVEQPYEFAVALDGEPAEGGPDWVPTSDPGPEPADEPIKFDAASESETESTAESSVAEAEDSEAQEQAAAEEEASGFGLMPMLLGGAVVLLLIAAVVALVLRRKSGDGWQ